MCSYAWIYMYTYISVQLLDSRACYTHFTDRKTTSERSRLTGIKPLSSSLLLFLSQGVRTWQACAPVTSLSRASVPRRSPPPHNMSAWGRQNPPQHRPVFSPLAGAGSPSGSPGHAPGSLTSHRATRCKCGLVFSGPALCWQATLPPCSSSLEISCSILKI